MFSLKTKVKEFLLLLFFVKKRTFLIYVKEEKEVRNKRRENKIYLTNIIYFSIWNRQDFPLFLFFFIYIIYNKKKKQIDKIFVLLCFKFNI